MRELDHHHYHLGVMVISSVSTAGWGPLQTNKHTVPVDSGVCISQVDSKQDGLGLYKCAVEGMGGGSVNFLNMLFQGMIPQDQRKG